MAIAQSWRGHRIEMTIQGLGIVMYSPTFAREIGEGEDFFSTHYTTEEQVQPYIQDGTIVGFGTGSPGRYVLEFRDGYPSDKRMEVSDLKLRVGVRCVDRRLCFRDLYDLMEWTSECPARQVLEIPNGIYHVTMCSDIPASGIRGDNQAIEVYLKELTEFPRLVGRGVPTLL